MAFSAMAFADHPNKLGIGLVGGGTFGRDSYSSGDVGLALKLPSIPLYWGINLNMNDSGVGLGVTGDKYFYDQTLLREGSFKLDWYLGLGGFATLGFYDDFSASLGARVPVGLSWHVVQPFEVWLGIAPSLGVQITPFQFPTWHVAGEVGARVWL
jgi:hypothetical protein